MSLKITFLVVTVCLLMLLVSCDFNRAKLSYNKHLDSNKEYYVILMAGQSNMVGLGDVKDLENYNLPENVTFFNYNYDYQLKKLPYNFGPEVGLANRLNKEFPELNFIFIKYAIGASSINEWLPKVESKIQRNVDFGNIYGKFIEKADSITANYNTKNLAFLWMQGETDAGYKETSSAYESNFKTLIENVRSDFKSSELPVIFGKVNPPVDEYNFASTVQLAQKNISESIPNTYLIDTENLDKQSDGLHYSSKGLLDLGNAFGNIISKIIKVKNDSKNE